MRLSLPPSDSNHSRCIRKRYACWYRVQVARLCKLSRHPARYWSILMAKKRILIKLREATLYAFEGDVLKFKFDTATGRDNFRTEPGSYKILRKHKVYRSRKYNSPMPYAMFFSEDGKAIHQSDWVSGKHLFQHFGIYWFGSHGCAGLHEEDAKVLFEWTPYHTPVVVEE